MLNHFGSSSSVSYQILVIESPFIQVIFMKKHTKNPLFEGLCYNLKGLELFSKTNFESSWVSEGLKIWWNMYFVLPFWFLASTFFVPSPLNRETYTVKHTCKLFPSCNVFRGVKACVGLLLWMVWAKFIKTIHPKNLMHVSTPLKMSQDGNIFGGVWLHKFPYWRISSL